MYRILILVHTDETPFWIAETIKAIEETGKAACTVVKINLTNEGGNTNLRYFSWISMLGNFFNVKNGDRYFENVKIKAEYILSSLKELEYKISKEKYDYVIWLGDSKRVNEIKSYCSQPLWYFNNVTTKKNRIDSAFLGLFYRQHWTSFGFYENFGSSTKLIGWAVSNNSKYSLQAARISYAAAIGVPARVLSKKQPCEQVLPWNNYNKLIEKQLNFWFAFRLFIRFVKVIIEKIYARIRKPRWVIGLVNDKFQSIEPSLDASKIQIIKHPDRNKGWADSFLVENDGKPLIFAEEIDENGKGHLVVIEVEENEVSSSDILKEKFHLSYPFVFEYDNEWHMIPESSENKKVSLYKAEKFPYRWKWQTDLLDGIEMVDATIFEYENIWWLFANGKKYADSFNEELHIFYADSPFSKWRPHLLNPVVNDIRMTRCAGRFRTFNNELYRPVQDCSLRYGHRIIWNKILKLSTNEFIEEPVGVINPDWVEGIGATHTIDGQNNFFVLDAYTK